MVSSKRLSLICFCATFFVFLTIFLWGIFGLTSGDEMGFSVLNFYLIMPSVFFAAALLLGIKNAYMKWAYPVFAGILGFIVPSLVFSGINWISLFFSFFPSMIGLGIGTLVWKLRARRWVDVFLTPCGMNSVVDDWCEYFNADINTVNRGRWVMVEKMNPKCPCPNKKCPHNGVCVECARNHHKFLHTYCRAGKLEKAVRTVYAKVTNK